MSDQEKAKALLRTYPLNSTIAEHYEEEEFSSACILLIPFFEYPNWSHKTILQVLQHATH